MKLKLTFLSLLILAHSTNSFSQTFFDNLGKPIVYYNPSNNILFDYSGNPKFYFTFDNLSKINLYDFEGHHIAWLSEGILRDHEGKILASEEGRIINITYSLEPIKPIEKIASIKKIEEIAPIQPISVNEFSSRSLLYEAYNNSTVQTTPEYLQQRDYSKELKFTPYQLPTDAIFNAVKTLNDRHIRLLAQGYIYDAATNNYYTKEQYASLESKRNAISKSYYDVLNEARKTNSSNFSFKNPKKKTWYFAYFGNPELGVYGAKVLIKKSGKIKGFYFTHPQYGYMFFGLYGKPKVNFPSTEVSFIGNISKFRRSDVGTLGSAFIKGTGTLFWHRGLVEASK